MGSKGVSTKCHHDMQRLVFYFSSNHEVGCHPAASGTSIPNESSGRACEAELSFVQLPMYRLSKPPGTGPLDLQQGAEHACALLPRTVLVRTHVPFCWVSCESRNTQEKVLTSCAAAQVSPGLVRQHCVSRQGLQLFTSSYREGAHGGGNSWKHFFLCIPTEVSHSPTLWITWFKPFCEAKVHWFWKLAFKQSTFMVTLII